jgi:hypothetical protein
MALPSNDKIIGDLGHTADHNAIVDEIIFIKDNYLSASSTILVDNYLRIDTASATYATSNSPQFTGTPLAPTAASGTNTTQIATTAFVRTEISGLIGGAPELLDTLNEIAAAINDDENFFTTVTNSLSFKLDSATASATYLTQSDASDLYFPKSASGGLLTEQEASELYFPLSASGGFLTESEASELYFPLSASGGLLTESEASELYLPISASSTLSPVGYLTEASASAIYLTQSDAESTYLPISASSSFSPVGYLTASAAADIYAPLDSPNFIGVPTAPTASAGNSSTQLATTQFVTEAVVAAQSGSVNLSDYLTKAVASATYFPLLGVVDGGAP